MNENDQNDKLSTSSSKKEHQGLIADLHDRKDSCMRATFLYVTSIFGTGVKLGPVAVLDEIGLLFFGFFNAVNQKISIKYNIYTITLIWFLINGIIGLRYGNINTLRYIAIPALLLLIYNDLNRVNISYIIKTSALFIVVNIAIPVIGKCLGLGLDPTGKMVNPFWWQTWLWTGTAYSCTGVFFAAVVLIMVSKRNSTTVLVFIGASLIAVLMGSRLLSLLLLTLIVPIIFRPSRTKERIQIVVFLTFAALTIISVNSKFIDAFKAAVDSADNILFHSGTNLNNNDRMDHIRSVFQLYERDKLHFALGHGTQSHQYDLTEYLEYNSSDGRVRPTGLPAIVFDGGIVLLALIVMSAAWAMYIIYKESIRIKAPLYILYLCLMIPFVSLLVIPVTNTMEMVLWWLAIAPNGLGYILMREHPRLTVG